MATMVLTVISAEEPVLAAGLAIGEFAVGVIGGELAITAITSSATLASALGPAGVLVLGCVAAAGIALGTYYLFDYLGGLFKNSPKEWTPQSRVSLRLNAILSFKAFVCCFRMLSFCFRMSYYVQCGGEGSRAH